MTDPLDPEEVIVFVAGQVYPANLPALLDRATANGAPDVVLDTLGRLPDLDYNGPTAVRRALLDLGLADAGDV